MFDDRRHVAITRYACYDYAAAFLSSRHAYAIFADCCRRFSFRFFQLPLMMMAGCRYRHAAMLSLIFATFSLFAITMPLFFFDVVDYAIFRYDFHFLSPYAAFRMLAFFLSSMPPLLSVSCCAPLFIRHIDTLR